MRENIPPKFALLPDSEPEAGFQSWEVSKDPVRSADHTHMTGLPLGSVRVRDLPHGPHAALVSRSYLESQRSTMKAKFQQPKEREGVISELNTAIETLNLAKEASGIAQAKAVFGSVSIILATIRVSFLPVLVDRL